MSSGPVRAASEPISKLEDKIKFVVSWLCDCLVYLKPWVSPQVLVKKKNKKKTLMKTRSFTIREGVKVSKAGGLRGLRRGVNTSY